MTISSKMQDNTNRLRSGITFVLMIGIGGAAILVGSVTGSFAATVGAICLTGSVLTLLGGIMFAITEK